jgi:hypothetical protein
MRGPGPACMQAFSRSERIPPDDGREAENSADRQPRAL